ncbi:hypothetical protein ACFSVM_19565 [Paenibacillus shunpengii]|uniref:Spermidine synthase n=1 Tax=Paenibacillus shunpengii TaxID=2054424 RepID=A0ABW5SS69_9BACL
MKRDKETRAQIEEDNRTVFALLSHYLNQAPDLITTEEIQEITAYGVTEVYAFNVILAGAFGLDINEHAYHKELFDQYFTRMTHKLDVSEYDNNPYYKNIEIPNVQIGNSRLKYERYKPYEGFVCNDIIRTEEGRQLPQIGFFDEEFRFPAVLENDRIWMTITPNEIETMKEPVEAAFGHVLTFGLGLGYYAYMVSIKDNVSSVTIVEANEHVIRLFKKHILPQFAQGHKIYIIQADAFEYAERELSSGAYDYVFTDLWHDVSDGAELYLRMKSYEQHSPETVFSYWIEKSILCYL